ncbi:MAG: sn-glycerol-3-phosphate ABC transporter ATP-binding protein UgpC [Clostridiaceae bacterium]
MAGVQLTHVFKEYDKGNFAVSDFSLQTGDHEFVVLVGPSGCGKSTTLRMIAGLETITGGEIFIDGKLVNNMEPKDRDIAMVFQNYALYPHMTVFDNIALSLQIRHVPKDIIRSRVQAVAETLGIAQYLKKKPRVLSGGQRQRVALGRAIVRQPKVFLLDEPLSNLDAKLRNQMRAEIIKLYHSLGTTFIYVTHDQVEAMTMATKIVVMNDGVIQQIGSPREIYHHPANVFTAGFMGSPQMNFFEHCKLDCIGGRYCITLLSMCFPLSEEAQTKFSQSKQQPREVIVGIRPEDVRLAAEGDEHRVLAWLEVSEMLGSEVLLHMHTEHENFIIRIPESEDVKLTETNTGEAPIELSIAWKKVHLFDAETKENLM